MTILRNQKLVIIFVFISLSLNSFSSSASSDELPYAEHCASVVPASNSKVFRGLHPFVHSHRGYYHTGGDTTSSPSRNSLFDVYPLQNSIELIASSVEATDVQGLFKLGATLQLEYANTFHYVGNSSSSRYHYSGGYRMGSTWRPSSVEFRLSGFWSESAAKLCMVGNGYRDSKQGTSIKHPAVLKLYNVKSSTSVETLISGTLESLISSSDTIKHSKYFNPISLLMFPRMNYQYTLVSKYSNDNSFSGGNDAHDLPSYFPLERFCSQFSRVVLQQEFDLKYSSQCVSAKNCTPLAESGYFPRTVSFKDIECLEESRSLRVLMEFAESSNYWYQRPVKPNTTLVAEGSWDAKNNQINLVACQFSKAAADTYNDSHVENCSTKLSLRFPAIWTIGHTSSIVGDIWSNKSKTESGYFEKITFKNRQSMTQGVLIPGIKYEYTKLDQVAKLCPRKKTAAKNHKTNMYPSPFSYDMAFDMSSSNSMRNSWGNVYPLSVENQFYEQHLYSTQYSNSFGSSEDETPPGSSPMTIHSYNRSNPTNISYRIRIHSFQLSTASSTRLSKTQSNESHIFAEGVYDGTEGSLCMIGCRNGGLINNTQTTEDSLDCEVVVNVQFPSTNQNSTDRGVIMVSIESTRNKSDPLHFERMDFSSNTGYMSEAERSIWRVEMEIILVLISTTLAGVFVALQIFHVNKHRDVAPSISILMLLILTLGYMIRLMLNFDAMFTQGNNRQYVFLGRGWLEMNEVIVRVLTMVVFLLQVRLLQRTWSARSKNGKQKELRDVEIKTLPVYGSGIVVVIVVLMKSSHQVDNIFGAMKSYTGLVLDGFLLPQILVNMICNSKGKALSVWFYIGTTLVRVVPHAYDLYRARSFPHRQLRRTYVYASPGADFYSTFWDVSIPIVGLLFAVIIFLQQKFGGRCILPQRLRQMGSYQKIPAISDLL